MAMMFMILILGDVLMDVYVQPSTRLFVSNVYQTIICYQVSAENVILHLFQQGKHLFVQHVP